MEDAQLNVWLDKKSIVEGKIGNLLCDPDNDKDISTRKERILSVFKLQGNEDNEAIDNPCNVQLPHPLVPQAGDQNFLQYYHR